MKVTTPCRTWSSRRRIARLKKRAVTEHAVHYLKIVTPDHYENTSPSSSSPAFPWPCTWPGRETWGCGPGALLPLADQLEIDLLEAADRKLAVNEGKYPAERVRGSARKYSEYD